MQPNILNRWKVAVLLLCMLVLSACSQQAAAPAKDLPAQIEPIAGTELNRVTLTEKAAERLALQTDMVREVAVNGANRKVVPYSSVIYDLKGDTWIYTSSAPLTFERAPITIDFIDGDMTVLLEGPEVGVEVASVGVAELYGIDTGVGK